MYATRVVVTILLVFMPAGVSNAVEGSAEVSTEFIAAEQLRCSWEIAKYDFVATESGNSEMDDSGKKLQLSNVYRVVRGEQSVLMTTETRTRVLLVPGSGKKELVPAAGASRLLVTPRYVAFWQDVSNPQVQIRLVDDWNGISKRSGKNEFEIVGRRFRAIDPALLSFGMQASNPFWNDLKNQATLDPTIPHGWRCVPKKGDGSGLVHLERYFGDAPPDSSLEVLSKNGCVVTSGVFEPRNRQGNVVLKRVLENKYDAMPDGTYLLRSHEISEFDAKGDLVESCRIDYSKYARSSKAKQLQLADFELPDGALIQRVSPGGGIENFIWRQGKVYGEQSGKEIDFDFPGLNLQLNVGGEK